MTVKTSLMWRIDALVKKIRLVMFARRCYIPPMDKNRIVKFDMRADDEFLHKVDELRRDEPDLPSRAQIVRRAIDALFDKMEQRKKRVSSRALG